MAELRAVPCTILRGGTSKGIYLVGSDLPADAALREKVILAIFGSPDKRQIDGLGGADPLTSKVAVVDKSAQPGIDIEYTFGQVSIEEAKIFYHSLCGNITSGVAPFAINAGLVKAADGITKVRMYNRNTGKIINAEVPVADGKASCVGDYAIAGVPGTGAKINVDFSGTAGALTGKLLPTGNPRDTLKIPGVGEIEVSIVDCSTCQIYVRAEDVGLAGTESPAVVDSQPELLKKLEAIRAYAAYYIALADTPAAAAEKRKNTPHLAIVSAAQNYKSHLTGAEIAADSIDFTVRMMFMQIMHKTYAGTGSVCVAVASQIPGTLVAEAARPESYNRGKITFGHPAGTIEVEVGVTHSDGQFKVERAAIGRTARMILEGKVYVRESLFQA